MKKTILAVIVTSMFMTAANASVTVFRVDQTNGKVDAQLNATGTPEAPTANHVTIQGDDTQTYDLTAMTKGITDNATAASDNAQQIIDNKMHTDAWITSVAADAATNVDLQKEVTRATGVEVQHTTELASHDAELGDHENRLVDMKKDVDGNTQDIKAVNKVAQNNTADITKTNSVVAKNTSTLTNHEQRLQTLEANNNANFGDLKTEMDENRQRASAAISGVAAMANIPQVIQGQTLAVGAGVGTTDGESALAVGFSARTTEHVIVKASVSDDSQQNFVVGGGVAYGW